MLQTWEAASDNDLAGYSSRVILNCYYKDPEHSDVVLMGGATNTSATLYRVIRSAPSGSTPEPVTPWLGKENTGACFTTTGGVSSFRMNETFSRCENIGVRLITDGVLFPGAVSLGADSAKAIGCVAYDCTKTSTGWPRGFYAQNDVNLFYACIAVNNVNEGFVLNAGTGETEGCVACTAISNGTYGFSAANANGLNVVWSCYAGNNTTADFSPETAADWDYSDWNAAGDTTADLGGDSANYTNSKDYWDGGADDAMDASCFLTATVAGGRNPVNDLSASWDPDTFFTAPDALLNKSIHGGTRPSGTDATWDVGADEYVATANKTTRSNPLGVFSGMNFRGRI